MPSRNPIVVHTIVNLGNDTCVHGLSLRMKKREIGHLNLFQLTFHVAVGDAYPHCTFCP